MVTAYGKPEACLSYLDYGKPRFVSVTGTTGNDVTVPRQPALWVNIDGTFLCPWVDYQEI